MTTSGTPVVHDVVVAAELGEAFRRYTDIARWWPRSHHLGEHGIARVTLEGEVGGRIFQTDKAGVDHVWSIIKEWDPPNRFVASWELGPTFEIQTDRDQASEFEVRFSAVGNSTTRVELQHRAFDHHGPQAGPVVEAAVNGANGWPHILGYYKRHGDRWVPPAQAGEREMLVSFLDYYRAELVDRAFDLDEDQLRVALAPSSLTLSGLIGHMAAVELGWFKNSFAGEEITEVWATLDYTVDADAEMGYAQTLSRDELLSLFDAAVADSRARVEAAESLDQLSAMPHPRTGEHWNLRWILVHMIEEYARHCGHADLIRESIDGDLAW